MLTKSEDPKSCTQCQSNDWGKYVVFDPKVDSTTYYIYCWNCGCRTKEYPTREAALEAWNQGKVYKQYD